MKYIDKAHIFKCLPSHFLTHTWDRVHQESILTKPNESTWAEPEHCLTVVNLAKDFQVRELICQKLPMQEVVCKFPHTSGESCIWLTKTHTHTRDWASNSHNTPSAPGRTLPVTVTSALLPPTPKDFLNGPWVITGKCLLVF